MAKYIELEEAVKTAMTLFAQVNTATQEVIESSLHSKFNSLPTADVVEVVHGRWVLIERTIGMKTYRCSECKDDDFWNTRFCSGYESYCPNCGARMDGE